VGLTNNLGNRVLQKLDNYLYDGVDHPLRLQHRLQVDATTFQTVYFEVDLAGNVRRLRGPAGEDLGGYRYTAFGKAYPTDATTPAAQLDQPLRWKGRWFNALTGLYDMRARLWSPELAVFMCGDEIGLLRVESTLWGWPGQNPLRYRDPTGRDAEEWFLRNGELLQNFFAGVGFVAGTYATFGLLAEAGALGTGAAAGWASLEAGFQQGLGWLGLGGATAAGAGTQLTPEQQRSVASLSARLAEHEAKLEAYIRNPDQFDNKDFLKNAPSDEIRKSIIEGRIGHLQGEIENFKNQIEALKKGGGKCE
jgi:RHS repeat-associated protein